MTIMFCFIICLAAFSTAKCDGIIQAKILTAFARQFRAPQPLAIFYNTSKETKIKLIKSMSEKGVTLHWNDELKYSTKFLLVISQSDGLLDQNEEIKMDQEIYYLTSSLDLYEKYTVNNIEIKQKLGHFEDGMYVTEKLIEQNILKRRQNFHGSTFIAMAIAIGDLSTAPYHPSNQTYEVTKLVRGAFFDVWKLLEIQLNFTTKFYKRKDGKWGVPTLLPNGTAVLTEGIIKSIVSGQADIAIANLGIVYNRQLVIDYIHPIVDLMIGIFVNKDALHETFDFVIQLH